MMNPQGRGYDLTSSIEHEASSIAASRSEQVETRHTVYDQQLISSLGLIEQLSAQLRRCLQDPNVEDGGEQHEALERQFVIHAQTAISLLTRGYADDSEESYTPLDIDADTGSAEFGVFKAAVERANALATRIEPADPEHGVYQPVTEVSETVRSLWTAQTELRRAEENRDQIDKGLDQSIDDERRGSPSQRRERLGSVESSTLEQDTHLQRLKAGRLKRIAQAEQKIEAAQIKVDTLTEKCRRAGLATDVNAYPNLANTHNSSRTHTWVMATELAAPGRPMAGSPALSVTSSSRQQYLTPSPDAIEAG